MYSLFVEREDGISLNSITPFFIDYIVLLCLNKIID